MAETPLSSQHFYAGSGVPFETGYKGIDLPEDQFMQTFAHQKWLASQTPQPRSSVVAGVIGSQMGSARMPNPMARSVYSTVKNPAQAERTDNIATSYGENQAVKRQSVSDYVKERLAAKPKNRAIRDEEEQMVGRVYRNGADSLQGDLDRNRRDSRVAVRMATQQALKRAGRERNVGQMLGGNSSYLNRAYGDTLARIMSDQALRDSSLGRENLTYLQGQRMAGLGARGRINDAYEQNLLDPISDLNQAQMSDIGLTGALGNLEDQNTIYDSYTPEQSVASRLSLLKQLKALEAEGVDTNGLFDDIPEYRPQRPAVAVQQYPRY